MADILIRGVRIPVACSDCPSRDVSVCVWTDDYNVESYKFSRPSFCPLHKLPEHGDLIDIRNAENAMFAIGNYHLSDYRKGWNDGIKAVIENAPVIVPSNKEETE